MPPRRKAQKMAASPASMPTNTAVPPTLRNANATTKQPSSEPGTTEPNNRRTNNRDKQQGQPDPRRLFRGAIGAIGRSIRLCHAAADRPARRPLPYHATWRSPLRNVLQHPGRAEGRLGTDPGARTMPRRSPHCDGARMPGGRGESAVSGGDVGEDGPLLGDRPAAIAGGQSPACR